MKSRFTILSTVVAFLLMLGLAVSPSFAQNELAFDVTKTVPTVVDTGHNQKMGRLTFAVTGELPANSDRDLLGFEGDNVITISYGGLTIANDADSASDLVTCAGTFGDDCAVMVDHDDGGMVGDPPVATPNVPAVRAMLSTDKTKLVIMVFRANAASGDNVNDVGANTSTDMIVVEGVRVDISGKDPGDEIEATVTASKGTPSDEQDVGGDTRSLKTDIAKVEAGIKVPSVTAGSALTCGGGGNATIVVQEGHAMAWEDVTTDGSDYKGEATQIRVSVKNLPADVQFTWPEVVMSEQVPSAADVLAGETLKRGKGASRLLLHSAANSTEAIYSYDESAAEAPVTVAPDHGHDKVADKFTIVAKPKLGAGAVTTGDPADVWAWLYPQVGSELSRETELSYKMVAVTDQNADDDSLVPGEFLTLSDCITYLLFPYVTCGSSEDWTTSFVIANTSKDELPFPNVVKDEDKDPVEGGATPQEGKVIVHAYPMSAKTADGASGTLPEATSTSVSTKLAAGDSVTFRCGTVISGDGYLVAEVHFRHAYGMAFVFGDYESGAAFDVAHGYMAVEVSDPAGKRVK